MIHKIKCVCGHLLNAEDVYQSGRADERCKVKDVYNDGFNNGHLIGEEVGKKKGYEQGRADERREISEMLNSSRDSETIVMMLTNYMVRHTIKDALKNKGDK